MKKNISSIWLIIIALCVIVGINSCGPAPDIPKFNSALLIGKWSKVSKYDAQKYEYYRFDAGGTGVSWDEGDDVSEAEAQPFTWTLSNSTFIITHKGEMGQDVPKYYTMLTLSSTTLSFKDSYGSIQTFFKTN
jgi:hypothetical protein